MTPSSGAGAPEALYDEMGGVVVWIRADLLSRSQARYAAWRGGILHEPLEHDVALVELKVRKRWMRETRHPDNLDWFTTCDKSDPGAVAYWEVTR